MHGSGNARAKTFNRQLISARARRLTCGSAHALNWRTASGTKIGVMLPAPALRQCSTTCGIKLKSPRLCLRNWTQFRSSAVTAERPNSKDRRPFLHSEEIRIETYAYMAGILKNLQCHLIKIGGVDDHVHTLSSFSKNSAATRPPL